jgi:hypothetical protein
MLAYLHCKLPPFDVSMQNLPLPVALADLFMLEPCDPVDGDICALATEMPAINAATAVNVVNVFMIHLLGVTCRACGMFRQRARKTHVPGTRVLLEKSFGMRRPRGGLSNAAVIA